MAVLKWIGSAILAVLVMVVVLAGYAMVKILANLVGILLCVVVLTVGIRAWFKCHRGD